MSRQVGHARQRRFFVIPVVTLLEDRRNVGEGLLSVLVTGLALEQLHAPPAANDYLARTVIAPASGFAEDQDRTANNVENRAWPERTLPTTPVPRDSTPLDFSTREPAGFVSNSGDLFHLPDDLLALLSSAHRPAPALAPPNDHNGPATYYPPAMEPGASPSLVPSPNLTGKTPGPVSGPQVPRPAWSEPAPGPAGGFEWSGGWTGELSGAEESGNDPSSPPEFSWVTITATDAEAAERWEHGPLSVPDPGEFTVWRHNSNNFVPLKVYYAVDGTATAAADYQPLPGHVTIAAGTDHANIPLQPFDDGLAEGDETVIATLTPHPSYFIGPPDTATVTIADDEPTIAVTASDPLAVEEGRDPGQFALTRTGDVHLPLTVYYAVAGTATPGDDYTVLPGTLTFGPFQVSAELEVSPVDDGLSEFEETVELTITPDPAYTIVDPGTASVAIRDTLDEDLVSIYAADDTAAETGHSPGAFTIYRFNLQLNSDLTVYYTISGTAANGSDCVTIADSTTIWAGSYDATITVQPWDDNAVEGDETIVLTLIDAIGYELWEPSTATVTIEDNDVAGDTPPVTENDSYVTDEDTILERYPVGVLVNDNDAESSPLTAYLVSEPAEGVLEFYEDGTFTYTPGIDFHGTDTFSYVANDGTADGNIATVTITVNSINDAPIANAEDYYVLVDTPFTSPAYGVTPNDYDYDDEPITASLVSGISHGTLSFQPDGEFTYSAAPGYLGDDTFSYQVTDGLANSDTVTVTLHVTEGVTVEATNPAVLDDGWGAGEFTVYRPGEMTTDLTIYFSVSGSATVDEDYEALAATVVIPAGFDRTTIDVVSLFDGVDEADETVVLTLSSHPSYPLGTPSTAVVALVDADLPVVEMSVLVFSVPEAGPGQDAFVVRRWGDQGLVLPPDLNVPLTVHYEVGGGAKPGFDYVALTGTAVISAGATEVLVPLVPINDTFDERYPWPAIQEEAVAVTLLPDEAYERAYSSGWISNSITITDDANDPDPLVTLAVVDGHAWEEMPEDQTVSFEIARTGNLGQALTVFYSLAGTAMPGVDYTLPPLNQVTIAPGAASAVIMFTVLDDNVAEGSDLIYVILEPNPNYDLPPESALGGGISSWLDICDEGDTENQVSIIGGCGLDLGFEPGVFNLTRSGDPSQPLTVSYTTLYPDTTANAADYRLLDDAGNELPDSGSITFPAGAASVSILVDYFADMPDELEEQVVVMAISGGAQITMPGIAEVCVENIIVKIDPITRGTSLDVTGPVNQIKNPAGIVIPSRDEFTAQNPGKDYVAVVQITRSTPEIQEGDQRVKWFVVPDTRDGELAGNASFYNPHTNQSMTNGFGKTAYLYGITAGRIKLELRLADANNPDADRDQLKLLETYEAYVVHRRYVALRVNLLHGTAARTKFNPDDVLRQLWMANFYLRQAGIYFAPDLRQDVVKNNAQPTGKKGIFRVSGLDDSLIREVDEKKVEESIRVNDRDYVLQLNYIQNVRFKDGKGEKGLVGGAAINYPGNATFMDNLERTYRIDVDEESAPHKMWIYGDRLAARQPSTWGVVITNTILDGAGDPRVDQYYGLVIAHEVAHALSLKHRDNAPFLRSSDRLKMPLNGVNLMWDDTGPIVPGQAPLREDLDFIQVRAMRQSKVIMAYGQA